VALAELSMAALEEVPEEVLEVVAGISSLLANLLEVEFGRELAIRSSTANE